MKLPTDWVFRDQWHLRNRVSGEFDIDVVGAWSPAEGPAYTGDGVRAVVIDDGFDYDHPDLRDNYNRRRDTDYALGTDDPFGNRKNEHGTAVAGLIAAAADGWGAVGVAYDAEIVGYRVAFNDPAGDLQIARGIADAATGGGADVINLSLGQVDLPWFGEGLPRNVDQAYARAVGVAVEEGRGGLGTTLAKSAGNDREDGYDVNADIWNNDTRQVIVAGVERDGSVSSYSNFGAALLVSAFGTDWEVVTTDRTGRAGYQPGDYAYFAGTSAAAPMVTGVVALMLEAEDGLGWRDVQSILAASARHVGTRIGGAPRGDERFGWDWNGAATWNGGGQHFSNDYGYGLVDARVAVRLAETWLATGARAATSATEVATELDLLDTPETLPRGTGIALEVGGTVGTDDLVERVLVTIDVEASRMQDLIATITAPSGTTSALIAGAGDGPFDGRWTLESQAFRGERAGGIWTVSLTDVSSRGGTIVVSDVEVSIVGDATQDDRYVFTGAYSDYVGVAGHARAVTDSNGGQDTVNAAALRSGCEIRLDGSRGVIDGVGVRFSGIENAIGGDGDDSIIGDSGANRLSGMRGSDRIQGADGDDRIAGDWGDDRLLGGAGEDRLDGGRGHDAYVFRTAGDAAGDVIRGFDAAGPRAGDRIDLGRIDANATLAGNQAFVLRGGAEAGSLRCVEDAEGTRLLGYVDASADADFVLLIDDGAVGAAQYRASDFVL